MSWDDGKHAKVKRVQITFDDVIRSIEVEYDGTSLKSQPRGTAGTKSDGFTLSPDEYITEMNGYYKTVFSGDVITALTFKTNKKTYGPYGDKTRNYFSLNAPTNNQIAGFFGSSSSNALNSIDAHFAPVPTPGSTATGGGSGSNPGSNNPSTNATGGSNAGTNPSTGGSGSNPGGNNPSTEGTGGSNAGTNPSTGGSGSNPGGNNEGTGGSNAGTNPGTGNTGSNPGGNNPSTEGTGGSNAGSTAINPGTGGDGSNPGGNNSGTDNTDSSPQKVEAKGGKGGNQWDDGADHDGVMKIYVAAGGLGIEQIRFDYIKNGQSKQGPAHGVKGRSVISTIVISHPDEYLVSVKGCYDSSNIIQGIQFKTNTKTSEYFGYEEGRPFSLEVKDKKIVGFHGFADTHLNSLGAYFAPISTSSSSLTPPNKVEAQGGNYGETFDDGAFDHVKKVYVGQGDSGVAYVKFDYEKDGKKETREHGIMTVLGTEEFELDPDDYITSIEVYVDNVFGFKSEVVTALVFKTFKGKTSQPFGMVTEKKFELKDGKGGKLAGFHGKASDVVYALGAYFAPTTN